jgi:hypothetical protein
MLAIVESCNFIQIAKICLHWEHGQVYSHRLTSQKDALLHTKEVECGVLNVVILASIKTSVVILLIQVLSKLQYKIVHIQTREVLVSLAM